jgi:hypothetical protein
MARMAGGGVDVLAAESEILPQCRRPTLEIIARRDLRFERSSAIDH